MTATQPRLLRFELATKDNPQDVLARFYPGGNWVLNRTEWLGKEPRSCGVTSVRSRPYTAGTNDPVIYDIEVTYKPKGHISFAGSTMYDGWTALLPNRSKEGVYLDGSGKPLPDGESPIYLPFEVHKDIEFNEIDFGVMIEEQLLAGVERIPYQQVENSLRNSRYINSKKLAIFTAPRKLRPTIKVILSDQPSGISADGFGTRIVNISHHTPHLNNVVMEEVTAAVEGFVEGRFSLNSTATENFTLINIDDLFVDCTANSQGGTSRFKCLGEFVEDDFLENLAKRLIATYEIQVTIVDGTGFRLLLKQKPRTERSISE